MGKGSGMVPTSRPASRRFDELDALRGLAAVVVLVGHALRTSPWWGRSELLATLDRSPLHVFVAGREAVILFFALSGFVLSLPYWAGKGTGAYRAYAVKRIFRIYVPYLIAMALTLGLFVLVARGDVPGMSEFFYKHWSRPLTFEAVRDHVLFIAPFDAGEYGMVYWTLIHELRISLVFPFLMFGLVRLGTAGSLLTAALFSISGTALTYEMGGRLGDGSSEWPVSVHLVAIFILGALVAKHREQLVARFSGLSWAARVTTVVSALTAFLYARRITDALGENAINQALEHWVIALGACTIMVAVMAGAAEKSVFRSKPLGFLGRTSYSLYLFHAAILWALVYVFHDAVPIGVVLGLVAPASVVAAYLAHRWIEAPAMATGKAIAASLEAQRRALPVYEQLFKGGVWNRAAYAPGARPTTPW